jgi:hypothetical protein
MKWIMREKTNRVYCGNIAVGFKLFRGGGEGARCAAGRDGCGVWMGDFDRKGTKAVSIPDSFAEKR